MAVKKAKAKKSTAKKAPAKKAYRFITGPDDSEFCARVAQALEDGYVLYGNPQHTYNKAKKMMYCGQAVILKKYK